MPVYVFKNFGEYWDALTNGERRLLAELADIPRTYLYEIARGYRRAGERTIAKLGKVSPQITPRLLRPDLYGKRDMQLKGLRRDGTPRRIKPRKPS